MCGGAAEAIRILCLIGNMLRSCLMSTGPCPKSDIKDVGDDLL